MSNNKSKKSMTILTIVLLLIFIIMIGSFILSETFKDYGKARLHKNSNKIFSIEDLKINDLKFGNTYDEVVFSLGMPKEEKEEVKNAYNYKVLIYDGLKAYLKENYDNYILVKVEITSNKYISSRNITVGNKITKLLNSYKIENKTGAYLYGNYTNNALKEPEIKNNIYFGYRTSENITYVNRESITEDTITNIAILDVTYKNGRIKSITWSYDLSD